MIYKTIDIYLNQYINLKNAVFTPVNWYYYDDNKIKIYGTCIFTSTCRKLQADKSELPDISLFTIPNLKTIYKWYQNKIKIYKTFFLITQIKIIFDNLSIITSNNCFL